MKKIILTTYEGITTVCILDEMTIQEQKELITNIWLHAEQFKLVRVE